MQTAGQMLNGITIDNKAGLATTAGNIDHATGGSFARPNHHPETQ
jgi:hypothetical protein